MKHVIVIETKGRPERIPDAERLTQALIGMVEELVPVFEGECIVRSRFYVESAVEAVCEIYNIPKRESPNENRS